LEKDDQGQTYCGIDPYQDCQGINIHIANTIMSGKTTPADAGVTPSLAELRLLTG
jgi:hypothetical protein